MDERQKSHFLSLYCMILADGIIDAKEMETLYEIASRNYGLTPEDVCQAVKEAGTSYYVPQTLDEKVGLLYDMCLIAIADGTVDDSERRMLQNYTRRMGFDETNIDSIIDYLLKQARNNQSLKEVLNQIQGNHD